MGRGKRERRERERGRVRESEQPRCQDHRQVKRTRTLGRIRTILRFSTNCAGAKGGTEKVKEGSSRRRSGSQTTAPRGNCSERRRALAGCQCRKVCLARAIKWRWKHEAISRTAHRGNESSIHQGERQQPAGNTQRARTLGQV